MFLDQIKIKVKAGDGGRGCESYKITSSKKKIPDGGSGGKGGDVIIKAVSQKTTLIDFCYKSFFKAESGKPGSSSRKKGKKGKDLIIEVPPGVVIKDCERGDILGDLKEGESLIVAKGGRGGRGNSEFLFAEEGQKGQERELFLELKLLAQVGLIGLPNAGKSTLINSLCRTSSKTAPYPFTTKSPVLGVLSYKDKRITIADIPGIIEGTHLGRGLGIKFLKHIERTQLLIYILDPTSSQGFSLIEQLNIIKEELRNYKFDLGERKYIICINKMDLINSKPFFLNNIENFKSKTREKVLLISALKQKGLEELRRKIFELLDENSN